MFKALNTLSFFCFFSAIFNIPRAVKRSVYFDLKQNAKLPESPFSCDFVVEGFCVRYSYFDAKILKFLLFDIACKNINHGSSNVLWQRATPAIAGWFVDQTGQFAVSGIYI